MKKFFDFIEHHNILVSVCEALLIVFVVVLFVCPISCSLNEQGILISSTEYTCPTLQEYSLLSSNQMQFVFSQNVSLQNTSLTPNVQIKTIDYNTNSDESCSVNVFFDAQTTIGKSYVFYGEVTDAIGNSLIFSVPFEGYNFKVPKVEITEIQPNYTGESKGNGRFKTEFVELHILSDGNLSGLEIFSVYDGDSKTFVLPAIDVKKDEIVVCHLRSKQEGCISELDDDFDKANSFFARNTARDLYDSNENARLGDLSDIVILRNKADNTIIDGVCYASYKKVSQWKSDEYSKMCKLLIESGVWSVENDENSNGDFGIECAIDSSALTPSKSLVKIASGNGKSCWKVGPKAEDTVGIY